MEAAKVKQRIVRKEKNQRKENRCFRENKKKQFVHLGDKIDILFFDFNLIN